MNCCLLCLESISSLMDCIQVNSKMWNKQNIEYLIEKHLWPIDTTKLDSSVCSDCCQQLFTFHTFYKRIEEAHSNLSMLLKTENGKLMEDMGQNQFNNTSIDNIDNEDYMSCSIEPEIPFEELISEDIDSDNFNESSLDIKDNEDYMEYNIETEIPPKHLISEKVDDIENEDAKDKKVDYLNSSASKDKSEEIENRFEKNENLKELKDGQNITSMHIRQTTKNSLKEKDNPYAKEENSKLNSSDQEVGKANTPQRAKSDSIFVRKIKINSRKAAAIEHDRIIAENLKIYCNLCLIPFKNFTALRDHFDVKHRQRGYVRCCNKNFFTRVDLVDHIYIHINPDHFKCIDCNKICPDRRSLTSHSKIHNGESKQLKCDKCGKTFARTQTLRDHIMGHSSEKQFGCTICGKFFTTQSVLRRHIKAIHQNRYAKICDICGKLIRCSTAFAQHMENHKTNPKTVSCDICGKVLTNLKGLKSHKKHQHPQDGNKGYKCDICGAVLSYKLTLERHKACQHPEGGKKEHKCHICSKVSANPLSLKAHIRDIHERDYNYKCTMCDQAFKLPRYLKEHLARHTGTPLYSCTWCSKTFTSSGNMYSHRKNVHPEEFQALLRQNHIKKYSN